jgi:hypothetical protein
MGSPGKETKVDVTQKNVPSTWMHDGSECHPGNTGFRNVEFCARTEAGRAKRPGMKFCRIRIAIVDRNQTV